MMEEKTASVRVEVSGLPEALALAERLEEKMKSVKTLAGELADLIENLSVNIKESGSLKVNRDDFLRATCGKGREFQEK